MYYRVRAIGKDGNVSKKDLNLARRALPVVLRIQRIIYEASQDKNIKRVHFWQKILLNLEAAHFVACVRVCRINKGKNTPGFDHKIFKTDLDVFKLARSLKNYTKSSPVLRKDIPKESNPAEMRPLGIPVMIDRAMQTLILMTMEPEWEAKLESRVFGFRPLLGPADAIRHIYRIMKKTGPCYVLDADIRKFFDRIDHGALLHKMGALPQITELVLCWLTATVAIPKYGPINPKTKKPMLLNYEYYEPKAGTPQGGPLSPLLANIALHGMQKLIEQTGSLTKKGSFPKPFLIRYADDFIVLSKNKIVIENCKAIFIKWLKNLGLELHPDKKKGSTHTKTRQAEHCSFGQEQRLNNS